MPDIYGRELTVFTDHRAILGAMAAPHLAVNDPIAARQLQEISQHTYDIRFKPGKVNLTADAMSRPPGVPLGDAYRPAADDAASFEVAALKETLVDITPQDIYQAQAESKEVEYILQGRHSPRNKYKISP